MGATQFATRGKGRTAREAFTRAVEAARHAYGHGGHTGTIAEKCKFIEVKVPDGMTPDGLYEALDREQKPEAMSEREWGRAFEAYGDKWGPAVAIPLGGGEWLFVGWASE